MKKAKAITPPIAFTPNHPISHNKAAQDFLNRYMQSHILYHMSTQAPSSQINECPIIKHALANYNQAEIMMENERISKQAGLTLFHTMNKQDNSQSQEQQQYSKYLKEYQTMVKCSRKRQYTSPQKTNKQMNLLIHEFLSDIQSHKSSEKNHSQIQKTTTPTKTQEVKVKVEKINLNTFSISKSNKNEDSKAKAGKQKQKKDSKQKTPRFININDMKFKKPEKIDKEKQKLQIQVKVKSIPSNQPRAFSPQKFNKHEKIQAPTMLQTFNPINQKQLSQNNYSSSYLKNKQIKDSLQSNKYGGQCQKKVKNEKKPLKIQIQIPVQQQDKDQEGGNQVQQQKIKELDNEREKIIKQISHTVFNLLHKNNRIPNKHT